MDEMKRTVRLTQMRRVIASRMCESLMNTAQFTLTKEISVDLLMDYIQKQKAKSKNIKFMHVLAKVVASLLKEHEMLNASIEENTLVFHDTVNMGVAVALPTGLLVPVIKGVENLSVEEFGATYDSVVAEARTGRMPPSKMSNGTFTLSNLGMLGIDTFTPIVNYPEAAILGIGRTKDTPIKADDGSVRWERTIVFSLTVDHRIVDGYVGAQFLDALTKALTQEDKLLQTIGN